MAAPHCKLKVVYVGNRQANQIGTGRLEERGLRTVHMIYSPTDVTGHGIYKSATYSVPEPASAGSNPTFTCARPPEASRSHNAQPRYSEDHVRRHKSGHAGIYSTHCQCSMQSAGRQRTAQHVLHITSALYTYIYIIMLDRALYSISWIREPRSPSLFNGRIY